MSYSQKTSDADRKAPTAGEPIPVAQYLRMSSEHQRYSLANQRAALQEYADARNLTVVKSYIDPARSGVTLRRRKGLQKLIADSVEGKATFKEVLVYDVSRWGRFQDHDESAHYEFLCRSSGIHIHYCYEPFENDGSPMSAIMKHIKRVMAADYSAALSARIHRAQLYQARLGFKQGGSMTYGVRRMLVDKDGNLRFLLDHGERKGLQTDRVIYVPGPDEELETVRRIFRMFVTERESIPSIARQLNAEGVIGARG
jgi:DNA invertase Pin-like site-specific DNA recombinase